MYVIATETIQTVKFINYIYLAKLQYRLPIQ